MRRPRKPGHLIGMSQILNNSFKHILVNKILEAGFGKRFLAGKILRKYFFLKQNYILYNGVFIKIC